MSSKPVIPIISAEIKALSASAAKCAVRECDEIEKGHFVAYVDEGSDSRDVSLQLEASGNMIACDCDCGAAPPCRHIAALLLTLAKEQAAKPTKAAIRKGKSAKQPISLKLLEEQEPEAVVEWLRDVLPKNKELELAFVYHFSAAKRSYSPEEVAAITTSAVKTVLGRAGKADPTQMKKILALWKDLHAPIIKRYLSGPTDEGAFLALDSMAGHCIEVRYSFHGMNKVTDYVQQTLTQIVPHIAALAQDEAFERASGFFIDKIPKPRYFTSAAYTSFIGELGKVCDTPRMESLARRMALQHKSLKHNNETEEAAYNSTVLQLLRNAGLFSAFSTDFKPVRWANSYNVALIEALIDIGAVKPAEKYAWDQVESNRHSEYNTQYIDLLEQIYEKTENQEGLVRLALHSLPETFNFEHYVLVLSNTADEEERKKLRRSLYTRARHMAHSNGAAASFSIMVLAFEEKWDKMIGLINEQSTPYALIDLHFDKLVATNKKVVLKNIMYGGSQAGWYSSKPSEAELEAMESLANKMMIAYGPDALSIAIADTRIIHSFYTHHSYLMDILRTLVDK